MSDRFRAAFVLPLLPPLMLGACGSPADSAPPPVAVWHVQDGQLRAPDGRVVLLRGANVAGEQKVAPYLDASRAEDYAHLHSAWGMNAIRFIMTWAAIEPSSGQYDEAYLDAVAMRLSWARDAGLSVILDMHEDVYGEGFGFDGAPRWACDAARYQAFVLRDPWFLNSLDPNVQACVDTFFTDANIQSHFTAAWQHVAQRFANEPAVVGFDVLNEPSWGTYSIYTFESDRLQPFYERNVAAVRQAAPNWVAFLEPGASRNLGISTSLTPFSFPNVVYSPHSYDSQAEAGSSFDPARRNAVLDNMNDLRAEATALGAALWVGEYGGVTDHPGYAEYMQAEFDAIAEVSAGSSYWSYGRGGGYSMLDASGLDRPAALAALVRPYPQRIAGIPSGISYDPSTATFLFRYRPDPGSQLTTEVFIPDSIYAAGYQVDCTGCTYEKAGTTLRLLASSGVTEVAIKVSK